MVDVLEPKGVARRQQHPDSGRATRSGGVPDPGTLLRRRRGRHRSNTWERPGWRLIRTGIKGLWPKEADWWFQATVAFFGGCGVLTFLAGMFASADNDKDAAWWWFMSGTVCWIGAFATLGFFIGPVTKAKHRR